MTSEIDKLKHFHVEDYSGTANITNLLLLNAYYNIQWEECSCLRGIRLEDVTVELEKEAYEEMRHNI